MTSGSLWLSTRRCFIPLTSVGPLAITLAFLIRTKKSQLELLSTPPATRMLRDTRYQPTFRQHQVRSRQQQLRQCLIHSCLNSTPQGQDSFIPPTLTVLREMPFRLRLPSTDAAMLAVLDHA